MTDFDAQESIASEIDRITPTERPVGRHIGYQVWSDLLFVHWNVPVDVLRPLIPRELEIDTFDGEAWLGLVPFYMSGVRPRFLPAVPWLSAFCETNLRTYVHFKGRDPGVWFFSLDAERMPVVQLARWKWHLNYFHAAMKLERDGDRVRCSSRRVEAGQSAAIDIEASIGPGLECGSAAGPHFAAPGTLEHFLAERYFLYCLDSAGRLFSGQVHHQAYPLRSAEVVMLEQSLSDASGITVADRPDHVLFSEGVTVDIFPLKPVEV